MKNDTTFNVAPVDSDECDAAELLINDPRVGEFFDALRQQPDGSWSVTFKRGETHYTLKQPSIRLLAVEFVAFSVEREQKRREQERKAEAEKRAAEEAARKRQSLLGQVLGGGH